LNIGDIRWFRYVPHWRVLAYIKAGWRYCCDLGPIHGEYSTLWEWPFDGDPKEPE